MTEKLIMPDFLIIGAGKSGTTSLDNYLKQHPKLFFSKRKEPNFFAYDNVATASMDNNMFRHYKNSITDINSYQKLFEIAREDQLKGETSNTYMVMENAAERINYYVPNAKLIAIVRQPTDRLYSRYLHLARENRLPTPNFEDVLDRNSIWWQRNDLVKEGFYYTNLSRFYKLFPKENIRVYLNEDLRDNTQAVMKDIFEFLGVEPIDTIDDTVQYNKSGFVKNKFYDKTLGHHSVFQLFIKKIMPDSLYRSVKGQIWLQKVVNNIRNFNLDHKKLDKNLHHKITKEIYSEDIRQLSQLLDRDLSHWLNK